MEQTIQSHIDKLDILREYLFHKIDNNPPWLIVNIDYMPPYSISEIMKIFNETGIVMCDSNKSKTQPSVKYLTFEEYYDLKQTVSNT